MAKIWISLVSFWWPGTHPYPSFSQSRSRCCIVLRSRHSLYVKLEDRAMKAVAESAEMLEKILANGEIVYGTPVL